MNLFLDHKCSNSSSGRRHMIWAIWAYTSSILVCIMIVFWHLHLEACLHLKNSTYEATLCYRINRKKEHYNLKTSIGKGRSEPRSSLAISAPEINTNKGTPTSDCCNYVLPDFKSTMDAAAVAAETTPLARINFHYTATETPAITSLPSLFWRNFLFYYTFRAFSCAVRRIEIPAENCEKLGSYDTRTYVRIESEHSVSSYIVCADEGVHPCAR